MSFAKMVAILLMGGELTKYACSYDIWGVYKDQMGKITIEIEAFGRSSSLSFQ